MGRTDSFHIGAQEHNPDFHAEGDTLHVGDRPYRMAMLGNFDKPGASNGFKVWRVPFESGHEMLIGGDFDERGRNVGAIGERTTGLVGKAVHRPTDRDYRFTGTEKRPLGGDIWENPEGGTSSDRTWVHMPTAEAFHRRVKEVSQLEGGGKGRNVSG